MLNLLVSTKRVVNVKLLCASLSANTLLITVFCTEVVNFHFFKKNIMAVIFNRKMHESDEEKQRVLDRKASKAGI